MKVAIFFVQLCLLLLKGGDELHAIAPAHARHHHAHVVHYQPALTLNADIKINYTHPDNQYSLLFTIDIEDEDTNTSFTRKCKWSPNYYSKRFDTASSAFPVCIAKANPSFQRWVFDKNILQRVLRV